MACAEEIVGKEVVGIPRDRNGEFEPKLIPKYQRDISGIEEKEWQSRPLAPTYLPC